MATDEKDKPNVSPPPPAPPAPTPSPTPTVPPTPTPTAVPAQKKTGISFLGIMALGIAILLVMGIVYLQFRQFRTPVSVPDKLVATASPSPQTSPLPAVAPAKPLAPLTEQQATEDIKSNHRYFEYIHDTELQMTVLAKARLGRMRIEKEAADLLAGKCCDTDPAKRMAERIQQLEQEIKRVAAEPKTVYVPAPPAPRPAAHSHPCSGYHGKSRSNCLVTLRNQQKWGDS